MKFNFKLLVVALALLMLVCVPVVSAAWSGWAAEGDSWVQSNGTYALRMWNATGAHTWQTNGNASTITEYLIVAGGGSGASTNGAGGGAGGLLKGTGLAVSGSVTVEVGTGGTAAGTGVGASGTNSTFTSISAKGGGRGGDYTHSGADGGSGGGASTRGGAYIAGTGISGQGYAGGLGAGNTPTGGGGGAGAAGGAGTAGSISGAGGIGKISSITGSEIYYAGGGGGGGYNTYSTSGGAGGNGGGGAGGSSPNVGTAGTNGLGGGGGGGSYSNGDSIQRSGGNGGSGVVIVLYVNSFPPVAAFTKDKTYGVTPLTVQFTDTSTNVPSSWSWEFNNVEGNATWIQFATTQNPSHSFDVGNFTIRMTATNDLGSDTITGSSFIKVYPAYTKVYFNNTGASTFTVPYGVDKISLLTVAGGGGGAMPSGGTGGGGGGAGGVIETIDYPVVAGSTYNIIVGDGGQYGTSAGQFPTNGGNTSFYNATITIMSNGGGYGAGSSTNAGNGGSGGGALTGTAGNGIAGQGYVGYSSGQGNSPYTAGGGGGAGQASTTRGGGNGKLIYWLTSTPFYIGGGGSGGSYATGGYFTGGLGGGGAGMKDDHGVYGTANTGGGGGGTGGTVANKHAGIGGSGTVIIGYIEAPLVSSFSTNFTAPAVSPPDNVVQFTDLSTGTPNSWAWTFQNVAGNNTVVTFATTKNPIHSFSAGDYRVILNASTSNGYSISSAQWINITQLADLPIPSFTSTTASGIVPLTVSFTDTTTNYPTSWKWDFAGGTGSDSTSQNPTHTFNTPGTYSINFTATSGAGSNSTIFTNYVTVGPMVATGVSDTVYGYSPVTAQFTGSSTGSPNTYFWDFGDGTTSSLQNPSHIYYDMGTYDVAFKATNTSSGSFDWDNHTAYIVIDAILSIPSFTSTSPIGVHPLTVSFTDTSNNSPTSWKWDFVGGTGSDSTLQNPSYTYSTIGSYSVNLTIGNAAGYNSTIFTNYITVEPMVATGTGNVTYGLAPLSVGFTGSSTGSPNDWYWEFGDGTTSTLQNPSYTYTEVGVYNTAFRALNTITGVYDWDNRTSYIVVTALPPVVDYTATPISGIVPMVVSFVDNSQNIPTSWNWTFGDGGVSDLQNPTHTYSSTGLYSINLTATNPSGSDTMIKSNYITVSPMVASFSADNTMGAFEVVAQFTGSSTGTPNTWYWDFGDGNTSTLQNPLKTYDTVGNYDVKMKATNTSSGAFDWENKTAYIVLTGAVKPLASFTLSAYDSYSPMTVSFTDTSSNNPTGWAWNFGDGNTSTSRNPTFIYRVPGSYTVSLNASNAEGYNISSFSYIQVSALPLAPATNFTWSNTQGISLPVTVQFTDLSSQSPTSWYWSDFGDGSGATSFSQNPTHVYTGVGAFPVTLSVTNINGTPSSRTKYVQITSTTGGVTSSTTTVGSQTIQTLTGNGDYAWTCPPNVYSVQYLLLGGGASGTNGGTVTGYSYPTSPLSFAATGGNQGASSTGTYTTVPGQIYQFIVGPGGVTNGLTSISGVKVNSVMYNLARYTVINGAGNGGYTYAFGSTAAGGIGGLSTGQDGSWNTNGRTAAGTNGVLSTIAGTYQIYGGDGSGYGYVGATTGGGNGYSYLGGASTAGSFYAAGGGAGDNLNGTIDGGKSGSNGAIILNYQPTVAPVIYAPVANFVGNPVSGKTPLTVQFTDLSTNTPTSWSWSFGDGGVSTIKNPVYTYNGIGSYTVTLTDYNSNATASGNFVRTNYINVTAPAPTPEPTPAVQSSTTWYVPRTITIHVVDVSSNQITGAQVSAVYNSSTLPGGVTELINYYGMNAQAANQATNGTLIMSGTTDSNGDIVFTMLSTLKYDLTVTSAGTTNAFSIHPQDSYYQLRFLAAESADTSLYNCLYLNGNTKVSAVKPDLGNLTMMWSYQDTCGLTTAVDYYVWKKEGEGRVLIYNYHLTPVTSGIYVNNYTVPNVRGEEYSWYENFTRSV